jgi:hypothetical protein
MLDRDLRAGCTRLNGAIVPEGFDARQMAAYARGWL